MHAIRQSLSSETGKETEKKCALLIGLNYKNGDPSIPRLDGTIHDVNNMHDYLVGSAGYNEADVKVITDEQGPIDNQWFLCTLKDFCKQVESYDVGVVYYSGHGTQVPDNFRTCDETSDECVVLSDSLVLDDDLSAIIRNSRPKKRMVVVWDCCNSATMADLPYFYSPTQFPTCELDEAGKGTSNALVISLSACRDDETAGEGIVNGRTGGYLTVSLLDTLMTTGERTSALAVFEGVIDAMSQMGQYPVLCSSRPLEASDAFV